MKKCILILAILFLVNISANAQTMIIKLKNGNVSTFSVPEIEKISFSDRNEKTFNPANNSRDAVISQMTTLAAMAQQYYRKPTALGGGGNSFSGFEIPKNLKESPDGNFTSKVEDGLLTIVGTAKVKKDNGKYPKVEMVVEKDKIKSVIIVE